MTATADGKPAVPPKTILIVEDHADFRDLLRTQLLEAGYLVVTAADGLEATRALGNVSIDLVLTDLLMPDRDGIEVIRDLRDSHPNLPVIAISGGGQVRAAFYLEVARKMGAQAILEKPFHQRDLLATIARLLPSS